MEAAWHSDSQQIPSRCLEVGGSLITVGSPEGHCHDAEPAGYSSQDQVAQGGYCGLPRSSRARWPVAHRSVYAGRTGPSERDGARNGSIGDIPAAFTLPTALTERFTVLCQYHELASTESELDSVSAIDASRRARFNRASIAN
ncbi:hypothetical protein Vau01_095240 [Virgisporangium aurantiacum]|uniref:Uncharacterized protein n=1 Tax=Virgisporangium aurantiacum TaxID=175570 RepID=A0A8J4E5E1_9ACTN|nr:hypothetical protein Vau01_095240 [Virgisporangium aurantiacum]